MFGHQNDESTQQDSNSIPDEAIHAVLEDQNSGATDQPQTDPAATDDNSQQDSNDWQHPGVPLGSDGEAQPISDVISPAGGFPKAPSFPAGPEEELPAPQLAPEDVIHAATPEPAPDPTPVAADIDADTTHELIDIKQHALTELLPLIDELDQPADEKFRTIMMMIQASDNQHLVKVAYETAHNIEDERVRARALLDIVNEINYFTQQPEN